MGTSGVMPIKDADAQYLTYSLASLRNAPLSELIVVTSSEENIKILNTFTWRFPVKIYEDKRWTWKNKLAEICEYGFSLASSDVIFSLFADVYYDATIFDYAQLLLSDLGMVSFECYDKDLHTSAIRNEYEVLLTKLFEKIDFKKQVWRGGVFATRKDVWERLHFQDVPSVYGEHNQFKDFKERMEGELKLKYHHISTSNNIHLRVPTFQKQNQILQGVGRAVTGYPLWRVLLHSTVHLKPYVTIGYLRGNRK